MACDQPPQVPHATYVHISSDYTFGDSVTYTCQTYYHMASDHDTVECEIDDTGGTAWIGNVTCERNSFLIFRSS